MTRPDAEQHVALFIRLEDPACYGQAAALMARIAATLDERGLPSQLTLASWQEHPGRYGEGLALTAAEHVFATDTTAAVTQIQAARAAAIPAQALAAASMACLAAAFAADPATGHHALLRCLPQSSGPLDRPLRDLTITLANPAGDYRTLNAIPGGDQVTEAWQHRAAALASYRRVLETRRDPATVLRTLLHEHHMRAVGLDPAFETQTGRLARAVSMRYLALVDAR
jgi:lantibiotic biosynthesis protein